MRLALVAGMTLREFYTSTVGEILEVINADHERRKANMVSDIIATSRAIACAIGGSTDPLEGLIDTSQRVPVSLDEVRRLRFWRD